MKNTISRIRRLFPGKAFYLLIVNIVALFIVSLFDLIGVAAILPVVQVVMGADYTEGYLGIIYIILGEPSKNGMVIWSSLILVLAFILKSIFSLLIKWWSSGFLAKQQTANSVMLLEAYANDSYINHRQRTTADILRSTNDANGLVYGSFVGGVLVAVGEGATIIMLMAMLLFVMPFHASLAFIYFGVSAYLLQVFLKERNKRAGAKSLETGWGATNATLNVVNGFRENKIHGMTSRYIYNYQTARLESVEASRLRTFYQDLPKYLLEVIFIIGVALILIIMIISDGVGAAANLIVFVGACVRILPSFVRMVASFGAVRSGLPSVELLDHEIRIMGQRKSVLISEEPDVGVFAKINSEVSSVEIVAKNIYFKYPDGSRNALANISFRIPRRSSIALVGGSGSGKTTLIDILLGLYEPTGGNIEFNHKNLHKNLDEWHNIVGYVPQDVYLSGKTIREEIAYGFKTDEIDEDRIYECIGIAELNDLVGGLEKGLDTVIGERGTRLSGGQRQRLGIARAIYRNPSILVLDEATSALDNKTEHEITKAINKLAEKITVIIVAHRLSTVRNVDQILFMKNGEVITRGTFSEVKENNSDFANLVELGQLPE